MPLAALPPDVLRDVAARLAPVWAAALAGSCRPAAAALARPPGSPSRRRRCSLVDAVEASAAAGGDDAVQWFLANMAADGEIDGEIDGDTELGDPLKAVIAACALGDALGDSVAGCPRRPPPLLTLLLLAGLPLGPGCVEAAARRGDSRRVAWLLARGCQHDVGECLRLCAAGPPSADRDRCAECLRSGRSGRDGGDRPRRGAGGRGPRSGPPGCRAAGLQGPIRIEKFRV